jgi:hypothetical protein
MHGLPSLFPSSSSVARNGLPSPVPPCPWPSVALRSHVHSACPHVQRPLVSGACQCPPCSARVRVAFCLPVFLPSNYYQHQQCGWSQTWRKSQNHLHGWFSDLAHAWVPGAFYSGFHFRPHMRRTRSFFVPEDPKLQAGSGTGRLDLPTKPQWPFSE